MTAKSADRSSHTIGFGTIAAVWLALIDLTALTVLVARVDPARFKVAGALTVASIKAGLVIYFFMHMKYEGPLLRWLLFAAVVTLAVFIGFTFFDVLYR